MADDTKDQGTGAKGSSGTSKVKDDSKAKSDDPGKAIEKAKADAQATGAKAQKEGGAVAGEVRKAASEVKDEAKQAASDVVETARGELQVAFKDQKTAGAERAQRIAAAIGRAGDDLGKEIPVVGDAMHRAAREIEDIAQAVRDREPGELLDVAQDFARRQPALFAGAIGLMGFAAVRFLMASSRSGSGTETSDGASTSGAARTGTVTMPKAAQDMGIPASGDPGGVSPAAPGFGSANANPEGGT